MRLYAYSFFSSPAVFAFFFLGARRGWVRSVFSDSSSSVFDGDTFDLQSQRRLTNKGGRRTQSTRRGLARGAEDRQAGGRLRRQPLHQGRLGSGLTGEEELGDNGAGGGLDNVVWLQQTCVVSIFLHQAVGRETDRG